MINRTKVSFQIPVSFLREGDTFVAYSPVFDLSTCGATHAEAKQRFAEAVDIFIEEVLSRGTLDEALDELGWTRVNKQWNPPTEIGHSVESFDLPVGA